MALMTETQADARNYTPLSGSVALVTGGSRGIGRAIALRLATLGSSVAICARDASALKEVSSELESRAPRVFAHPADVTRSSDVASLVEKTEATLGPISILVNNAAYSARDGFEMLDAAGLDAHYAVNVRGTALLSVEFARRFSTKSGGRIINVISGQDREAMPGELAYAASKGAISAFTRSLAKEVGPKGITVNAVDPGPTDTGWMSAELKGRLAGQNAMGRVGLPEDAARLIVFLASAAAEWISGEVIHARGI